MLVVGESATFQCELQCVPLLCLFVLNLIQDQQRRLLAHTRVLNISWISVIICI